MIKFNFKKIFIIFFLIFCGFLSNPNIAYSVTLQKVKDIANYGEGSDELLVPYGAFFDVLEDKFYITDCLGEKFIIYSSEGDYLKTVYLEKIGLIDNLIGYSKKSIYEKPENADLILNTSSDTNPRVNMESLSSFIRNKIL